MCACMCVLGRLETLAAGRCQTAWAQAGRPIGYGQAVCKWTSPFRNSERESNTKLKIRHCRKMKRILTLFMFQEELNYIRNLGNG